MGLVNLVNGMATNFSAPRRAFFRYTAAQLLTQDPEPGKIPIPPVSDEFRNKQKKTYAAELSSPASESVAKLLADAVNTKDDPSMQFTLLEFAAQHGAEIYDFDSSFRAIDKMAEIYSDVRPVARKSSIVLESRTKNKPKAPEHFDALASANMDVVLAAGKEAAKNPAWYDIVTKAASAAETDAKSAQNKDIEEKAKTVAKYVADVNKDPKEIQAALDSGDADMNLKLGKWKYFILNDEQTGLEHLSKSSDAKLKKFAGLTIISPKASASYYEIGDAASDAANDSGRTTFEKRFLQEEALRLYRLVLSSSTGATKTTYERDKKLTGRISELETKLGTPSVRLMTFDEFEKLKGVYLPAQDLASKGRATASSFYAERDPNKIFKGNRKGDSFSLNGPTGWLEASWQQTVAGRYIILFGRTTEAGHDQWGKACAYVNKTKKVDIQGMEGSKIAIIDLKNPIKISKLKVEINGSAYPGMSSIEIHPYDKR